MKLIIYFVIAFSFLRDTALGQDHDWIAERIWFNGNVLTCDGDFQIVSAFAVHDGVVKRVGDKESLQQFADERTEWIDLAGQTVTPGFCDSHMHFVGLGTSLQQLDLRTAKSWDEIINMVADQAATLPPGTWILGRGWHQSKWISTPANNVEGYPSHVEMSRRVPNHPVLLTHASGHASFANASAMRLAGIDAESEAPEGGEILHDESGNPCGVFRENAQALVARARNSASKNESYIDSVRRAVKTAGQECLKHGVTSVHDAGISFELANSLTQIANENDMPVRVFSMIREPSQKLLAKMHDARIDEHPGGRLQIRSVKVSIDGALGPHGAWLIQPYDDLPSTAGLNTVDLRELDKIATYCDREGLQLCVHAIGDQANRAVLDAFEKAFNRSSAPDKDRRWRVEHAQHIDRMDLPRFARLSVIPAMQANHCTSDALYVVERLGMRRASEGAYMWRDLIDSGVVIPNGTDAPVEPIDPRNSLFAAVTREFAEGEAFFPAQCMTRKEALWSYTLWPAIASFNEQRYGTISEGRAADFVVWDTDLLECKPQEIKAAKVLQTWLDGEQVYRAPAGVELP